MTIWFYKGNVRIQYKIRKDTILHGLGVWRIDIQLDLDIETAWVADYLAVPIPGTVENKEG